MILTTELRLKDKAGCAYLDSQLEEEYKLFMETYRELGNPQFYEKWESTSKFNTYLCQNYNILSRHANSLIYRVRGLLESYRGNKQWEIDDKCTKVNYLEDLLEEKLEVRTKLKKLAGENKLSEKERVKLKNLNTSVYHLRNRINKLKQKIKSLKKDLKNGKYRIGIGTKKLFKKQFNLDQTRFKDHEDWKRAFEEQKSHLFFYVGRGREDIFTFYLLLNTHHSHLLFHEITLSSNHT